MDRSRLFAAPRAWPAYTIPVLLASAPLCWSLVRLYRVWLREQRARKESLARSLEALATARVFSEGGR